MLKVVSNSPPLIHLAKIGFVSFPRRSVGTRWLIEVEVKVESLALPLPLPASLCALWSLWQWSKEDVTWSVYDWSR